MTKAATLCGAILAAALLAAAAAPPVPPRPPGLHLIPWPQAVTTQPGRLVLTARSRVVAAGPALRPLARVLADEVFLATGLRLPTADGPGEPGDIILSLDPGLTAGEDVLGVRAGVVRRSRDGAHRLTVTDRAAVAGSDGRAVAEGTATLLQLLRADGGVSLPHVTIDDWPHADFAAVMIDVGRQENTLDHLRHCVQVCRLYKVRYLQLHLTDDQGWTFPSTAFPQLGTKNHAAHGGAPPRRYDLAGLKDLVRYADERGVTLVPEIEMPGHSGAARAALPAAFGCVDPANGQVRDVGMMNIANPKLYAALDTLIGEVADVFRSSPYIHIGGDEVSGLRELCARPETRAFMKDHGLKTETDLVHHFVRAVNAMVRKRGRVTIVWEGPALGASPDVVVAAWDGNARTAERLAAQGVTTITCPWNLGVPWPDWNMYVCNGSRLKRTDPVLGAIVPAWEQGGAVALRMVRDGAPRRQERTWRPDNRFTAAEFEARLASTDALADRLLYGFTPRHDGPVTITADRAVTATLTKPVALSFATAVPGGRVRVARGGSPPGPASPVCDGPIEIDDNVVIAARLFDRDDRPLAAAWSLAYRFQPLSVRPTGLTRSGGKETPWFAEAMTVALDTTTTAGRVRYTLDGGEPTAGSAAYAAPITLKTSARLRARWFDAAGVGRGDVLAADYFKLPAVRHAAVGKRLTVLAPTAPSDYNAGKSPNVLVDGYLARNDEWLSPESFHAGASDLAAVIDLGEPTTVRRLAGRFLHMQESGVFPPVRLEFAVSDDGKTFRPAAAVDFKIPANPDSRGPAGKLLAADVAGVRARYVKFVARNVGIIPAWHPVAGQPAHLFADELLVNPEPAAGKE